MTARRTLPPIAQKALLLQDADPEIAASYEFLMDVSLLQIAKRRIANNPDVQATKKWARYMGVLARKGGA